MDKFIKPLLRGDYISDPVQRELFRIKYKGLQQADKTTGPDVLINPTENDERLKKIADYILDGKLRLVTSEGVMTFKRDGNNIIQGFELDDPLLSTMKNIDFQLVPEEGAGINGSLAQADIDTLLPAARKYWLDAGASLSILDNISIGIANLTEGTVGSVSEHINELADWQFAYTARASVTLSLVAGVCRILMVK